MNLLKCQTRVSILKKVVCLGLLFTSIKVMATENDTIINHYLNKKRAERKESIERSRKIVNPRQDFIAEKNYSAETGFAWSADNSNLLNHYGFKKSYSEINYKYEKNKNGNVYLPAGLLTYSKQDSNTLEYKETYSRLMQVYETSQRLKYILMHGSDVQ